MLWELNASTLRTSHTAAVQAGRGQGEVLFTTTVLYCARGAHKATSGSHRIAGRVVWCARSQSPGDLVTATATRTRRTARHAPESQNAQAGGVSGSGRDTTDILCAVQARAPPQWPVLARSRMPFGEGKPISLFDSWKASKRSRAAVLQQDSTVQPQGKCAGPSMQRATTRRPSGVPDRAPVRRPP